MAYKQFESLFARMNYPRELESKGCFASRLKKITEPTKGGLEIF